MPYIPNPNDATEPVDSRPAGTAAEEFRALKAVVAAILVTASASASPRHAIQSAVLDANGYNAAITTGAGLRPGLTASATDPYHLSYAAGFTGGKAINNEESIVANNADILGADLPLSNTSYLYRDYGVGYGRTLVPPQYGYAFDRTQNAILNFEGSDGSVIFLDDFGNTWTNGGANAEIDTAQFKFGTSSLLLGAGGNEWIQTSDIKGPGDGSWEKSIWFRINALPGAGNRGVLFTLLSATTVGIQIGLFNNAGTTRLEWFLSSNNSSHDIVNGGVGTNTVWTLNQWNRIRLVFDALAGNYSVYLSLNGAAETQDLTQASTARIHKGGTAFRIGADNGGGNGFNGWVDGFRFIQAATKTTTEIPAATAPSVTDHEYCFFSIPKMKMFRVSAASVAAGTNPTLTAVTRLFLGEADTSGVAVTAVRNYAIRGEFYTEFTTVTAGTSTTKNHNIGTIPRVIRHTLRVLQAVSSGTQGDVFDPHTASFDSNGANQNYGTSFCLTRNTVQLSTATQIGQQIVLKGGGAINHPAASNFTSMLTVIRGW